MTARRKADVCKTCDGWERSRHRVSEARVFYRLIEGQWTRLCPTCWAQVAALDQAQMAVFMRRRPGRPRILEQTVPRYSLESPWDAFVRERG